MPGSRSHSWHRRLAPRAKFGAQRIEKAEQAKQLRKMLGEVQDYVETNFDDVGDEFPDEARKIYYGESEDRAIYGNASEEEAQRSGRMRVCQWVGCPGRSGPTARPFARSGCLAANPHIIHVEIVFRAGPCCRSVG